MELLISNIKSKADISLFTELAKRLGLKTSKLSLEEKEEIGLGIAIQEGRKSGYVTEDSIIKSFRKIQGK